MSEDSRDCWQRGVGLQQSGRGGVAEELGAGRMADSGRVEGFRDDHVDRGVIGQSGVWCFCSEGHFRAGTGWPVAPDVVGETLTQQVRQWHGQGVAGFVLK